jgi:hypothetical protein
VVGAVGESSGQTTITNGTTAADDDSNAVSGAAYVYKRSGTTWAQEAYIKAVNNDQYDQFGYTVAINGDTIAVSALGESSNKASITNGVTASDDNTNSQSGAVYVYKRSGANWEQEAYLKAANNGVNDTFGYSIAINGDTIAIGTHHESSNQAIITNGVSASNDDSSYQSGAVYVYKRSGASWAQEAYIKASNSDAGDWFGYSLTIEGDTIVVGAPWESSNQSSITNDSTASDDDSNSQSGAVYVYTRSGSIWAQESYFKTVNNDAGDWFGYSVAADSSLIVVGAVQEDSVLRTITNGSTASEDDSITDSGAVYVYRFK